MYFDDPFFIKYSDLHKKAKALKKSRNNDDSGPVVNYIKKQEISTLDYVIGTHPHEDHIGGLDIAIDSFNVQNIIMPRVSHTTKTYKDVLLSIKNKGLKVQAATPGKEFPLGDAVC